MRRGRQPCLKNITERVDSAFQDFEALNRKVQDPQFDDYENFD